MSQTRSSCALNQLFASCPRQHSVLLQLRFLHRAWGDAPHPHRSQQPPERPLRTFRGAALRALPGRCPQVARQSLTTYVIIMNRTHIEIDVHRLNDGGLLLSYDGNSYTTYMKEEIDRYLRAGPPPALPADRQLVGEIFPSS